MIQHERIAENVYSFQSDVYAQVNAGAVIGPEWAVLIDTLPLPDETAEIKTFLEQELRVPVRYIILTHYHADHSWGACQFPGAFVISSTKTRELLLEKGVPSLENSKETNPIFENTSIVLSHMTFESGTLRLNVGKKTIKLVSLPGHSLDGIGVLVEEDRVLFSGDVFMPLPYIVDGDIELMTASLKRIGKMGLENIVQGHGDVVLRGEIDEMIVDHLAYLSAIRKAVRQAARRKYSGEYLDDIDVESCGKNRVLIGGLAEELHRRNLKALYYQLYGELPVYPEYEEDDY